ncbi:hypothetical protein [Streptomyces sp. NPDC094468]|uniref:hypothetical protein n=1 Tax=Streptomyces sp. NPDC094468 TaxID=3366066 RepID=UPI0038143D18
MMKTADIILGNPVRNSENVPHEQIAYLRQCMDWRSFQSDPAIFEFTLNADFRGKFHVERNGNLCQFVFKTLERTILLGVAVETTASLEATGMVSPRRRSTARRTTAWAARLAGEERGHLDRDWAAVLAGAPEDGTTHTARRQMILAAGFILAALRMRGRDLARPVWRPVDWLLRVQSRTNAFITAVVGAQAIYIVDDGGLTALVTEVWEPCGGATVALYALSHWLRRVRGIELASPEREDAGE